jgi:hypothetical protein
MIFLTRSQPPLVTTIPPFDGNAIAQTVGEGKPITPAAPKPSVSLDQSDINSVIIAGLLGSGALWIAIKTFGEKFGDTILTNRKNQSDIVKSQSDIELNAEKAKLEQAKELADFYLTTAKDSSETLKTITMLALSKVFETASQDHDINYSQQASLKDLIEQLTQLNTRQDKTEGRIHDILAALNMKDRE